VSNCGVDVDLAATVTPATGPTASWEPVTTTDTCSAGIDRFAYQLAGTLLSPDPATLHGVLAAAADRTDTHTLYMPCDASSGQAGETVTMTITYIATNV
jgi:hypothetical protein